MNIVVAGGTGLIGQKLVKHFIEQNHHVFILTRNSGNKKSTDQLTYVNWLNDYDRPEETLKDIDVLINLAGTSINSRWTEEQKQRILSSRIEATKNCLQLIERLNKKPTVFLNASAVGFYGTSRTETYTEAEQTAGSDFLATVVKKWEGEALRGEDQGVRTVLLRFGVVLANEGGALKKMILPYKLLVGGTIGSGQQWLSWIHIEDAIRMIEFAMNNDTIRGPLNVTSPTPVKMEYFGKALSEVLHRPHWLPTPSFALKLALGEMSLLVLEGQKVLPKKAVDFGFEFSYPELKSALSSLKL